MAKMEDVPFRFISSREILEPRQESQKIVLSVLIISEDKRACQPALEG